jgi:hypothetical protein
MNAGAAQPTPSDTTYKKVYQTYKKFEQPKNAAR